jgi:2-dehydropantoate 2-reductase
VTLVFHRKGLEGERRDAGKAIQCIIDGVVDRTSGFRVEFLSDMQDATEPIKYLIVATKANMTLEALRPLEAKLNSDSVILFLQNGMGKSPSSHTVRQVC